MPILSPATAVSDLALSIAIDWDDDGDFTGPGEDVTERVLAAGGFTASLGRDQARALAPPASGRGAFSLDNTSTDYSPENTDSPLAGDVLPARGVLATAALNGVAHTLIRGHLDEYELKVQRNSVTVDCTALDPLAKLKGTSISTQLHKGIRTGQAIGYVLDAVGWPAEARTLDVGATGIRWWWEENADAYDALIRIVQSEGPGATVHATEDGKVVFRDRHHRLLNATSTMSQVTLTDGTDSYEPAFSTIEYDHGWREVINRVVIKTDERDPSPLPETVWESPDVRSIAASSTLSLRIELNDPVIAPTVAYKLLAGTVTASILQTSGQALTLEFTTGGSPAALSTIVVSGQPVAVRRTYQTEVEDTVSSAKYGQRSLPHEVPWAGVHDAYAIANLIIGSRSERLPVVSIRIVGAHNPTRLHQQLSRDLSDRIHITEAKTRLDHDFYIEQIGHRISGGGFLETTFGCEKAVTQPANVFTFNDATRGFNDGVFGSAGLDSPANIFIFDAAGRGFNDGVFAT